MGATSIAMDFFKMKTWACAGSGAAAALMAGACVSEGSLLADTNALEIELSLQCDGCANPPGLPSLATLYLEPDASTGLFCVETTCAELSANSGHSELEVTIEFYSTSSLLALDLTFSMLADGPSEVQATVSGTINELWDDIQMTFPVMGTAEFAADRTAPTARIVGPVWGRSPILASFSEPVVCDTPIAALAHDGDEVPVSVEFACEGDAEFTGGVRLVPRGFWPAGELVVALSGAIDRAGNAGVDALLVDVPEPPQSERNAGFEEPALDEWLGSGCDSSGAFAPRWIGFEQEIEPPVGNQMAVCHRQSRLSGYLGSAQEGESLGFYLGIGVGYGLYSSYVPVTVTVSTRSGSVAVPVNVTGSTDEERVFYEQNYVVVELPEDARDGVWLDIENTGFNSQAESPDVLVVVDDVQFVTPVASE